MRGKNGHYGHYGMTNFKVLLNPIFYHLNLKLDLDPRNRADVCFYLFLYKHFVYNYKLVYIIIYIRCVYHFLKHNNFTIYVFLLNRLFQTFTYVRFFIMFFGLLFHYLTRNYI